jgi:hypothetical protein
MKRSLAAIVATPFTLAVPVTAFCHAVTGSDIAPDRPIGQVVEITARSAGPVVPSRVAGAIDWR